MENVSPFAKMFDVSLVSIAIMENASLSLDTVLHRASARPMKSAISTDVSISVPLQHALLELSAKETVVSQFPNVPSIPTVLEVGSAEVVNVSTSVPLSSALLALTAMEAAASPSMAIATRTVNAQLEASALMAAARTNAL